MPKEILENFDTEKHSFCLLAVVNDKLLMHTYEFEGVEVKGVHGSFIPDGEDVGKLALKARKRTSWTFLVGAVPRKNDKLYTKTTSRR